MVPKFGKTGNERNLKNTRDVKNRKRKKDKRRQKEGGAIKMNENRK